MSEPQNVRLAGGGYIAVILTILLFKTCSIDTKLKNIEHKLPAAAATVK